MSGFGTRPVVRNDEGGAKFVIKSLDGVIFKVLKKTIIITLSSKVGMLKMH
jgi:hypothetical protein